MTERLKSVQSGRVPLLGPSGDRETGEAAKAVLSVVYRDECVYCNFGSCARIGHSLSAPETSTCLSRPVLLGGFERAESLYFGVGLFTLQSAVTVWFGSRYR